MCRVGNVDSHAHHTNLDADRTNSAWCVINQYAVTVSIRSMV